MDARAAEKAANKRSSSRPAPSNYDESTRGSATSRTEDPPEIEFVEQVVRKIAGGLVDFVDEHDGAFRRSGVREV